MMKYGDGEDGVNEEEKREELLPKAQPGPGVVVAGSTAALLSIAPFFSSELFLLFWSSV